MGDCASVTYGCNFSQSPTYTYDPYMVLTVEDGCITFDFKAFNQSIMKDTFNWEKVEAQLNSLLPFSGYVLCPGLKEYPSVIHFESKNYMHILCPHERHQSYGCALWHVPKNRQQLPCSVLYNVCEQCKTLYNQLEIIRKRHKQFSPRPGNTPLLKDLLSIVLQILVF